MLRWVQVLITRVQDVLHLDIFRILLAMRIYVPLVETCAIAAIGLTALTDESWSGRIYLLQFFPLSSPPVCITGYTWIFSDGNVQNISLVHFSLYKISWNNDFQNYKSHDNQSFLTQCIVCNVCTHSLCSLWRVCLLLLWQMNCTEGLHIFTLIRWCVVQTRQKQTSGQVINQVFS